MNAEWINSFHADAASYEMDHSDNDDCNKENENEEESIKEYSQQTRKLWLELEEVLLLLLKDKQGIEWEEIYKRFPS